MQDVTAGVDERLGECVSWWVWALLAWGALAVGVAVVLGMGIRTADRRDLGRDRPEETGDPPEDDGS